MTRSNYDLLLAPDRTFLRPADSAVPAATSLIPENGFERRTPACCDAGPGRRPFARILSPREEGPSRHSLLVATLPEPLKDLETHAKKWAIGDDVERAEAILTARDSELGSLVENVVPRLAEIDDLLEKDPESEYVPILTALAETSLEAQQELARRTGDSSDH